MEALTSARNPLLKSVRQAVRQGTLTEDGCIVAEGPHLLDEALRSGCRIEAVLATERASRNLPAGLQPVLLPEALLRGASSTENSQGILALIRPRPWSFDDIFSGVPLVVALDGVQDPGNAGTMIRSAEAFGATGMVFLKGCVNPYNPKCVRASAGSLFRVPLVAGIEETDFLHRTLARKCALYAALPHASRTAADEDFRHGAALVIGSEGRGVGPAILKEASGVRLPTAGVESLNAAIAASILLYEAHRQRSAQVAS